MLNKPIAEHILLSIPDLAFTLCLGFACLIYLTWYPMRTHPFIHHYPSKGVPEREHLCQNVAFHAL